MPDSMEILLLHESVRKAWGARDRPVSRAREHVCLSGPSAKEAESWALQPGCRRAAAGKARIGASLPHAPTSRSDNQCISVYTLTKIVLISC